MIYSQKADEIVARALALNAERICFKTDGEFSFASLDEAAVSQVLSQNLKGRIKYQKRDDGRWVDCSTYSHVLNVKQLFDDLANDAFRSELQCSRHELVAGASLHPRRFHTALRTILRNLHVAASKSLDPRLVKQIRTLFHDIIDVEDDFFDYFLSTLEYQTVLFENGLREILQNPKEHDVLQLVALLDAVEHASGIGQRVALGNMKAQLLSLTDRESAAAQFDSILELDVEGILKFYFMDMGALTYFSSNDMVAEAEELAAEVVQSIESQGSSQKASSTAILISADPRFFRIYGHMMMFYAQQLPALDFVFVVVGDDQQTSDTIAAGRDFADSLSSFNSSGNIDNLRFFRCPIPGFVKDEITFFATSRFFAAVKFLEEYEGVYIMDIDLRFDANPMQYIKWLHGRTFACSISGGLPKLSPWRRYMAGNVFMRQDISRKFISDLQEYIVTGHQRENSWMMDQNALTYAIERSFLDTDFSTGSFGRRPTSQPAFRSSWEANFMRQTTI